MLYIICEDLHFYNNKEELYKAVKEKCLNIDIETLEEIQVFSKEDLYKALKSDSSKAYIISPFESKHFGFFGVLFTELFIANYHSILTKHEKEVGISESEKLKRKLDLVVEDSPFSFDDLSGSDGIKHIKLTMQSLQNKRSLGESVKTIFLVGVTGTGKSLFAQCLAGELKRPLVSLNLAKLMHEENPIKAFDMVIEYLVSMGGKYVLWLDEVEKMFTGSESSEHIKNRFLTVSNDIGHTINLDVYIVMTANNIISIMKNNPELLRGGRTESNAKFFMDFLKQESALNILHLYRDKFNNKKDLMIGYLLEAYCDGEIPKESDNEILRIFRLNHEALMELSETVNLNFNIQRAKRAEKLFSLAKSSFLFPDVRKEIYKFQTFEYDFKRFTNFVRDHSFSNDSSDTKVHNLFAYVPAELKEIATQFYIIFIFDRKRFENEITLFEYIVKNNIPIGEASKEAMRMLRENSKNFIIIN